MRLAVKIFLLIILSSMAVNAQDLKTHKWENRLVLVISKEQDSPNYKKQLSELKKDQKGLSERKLIIYKILPDKFSKGLESRNWKKASTLYEKYKTKNCDFQVLLIGLDGGIKLNQPKVLSLEKLFSTIHSMPMRQSEIRKNK